MAVEDRAGEGLNAHHLVADVQPSVLREMMAASLVELAVGRVEASLTDRDLAVVREFAIRLGLR